MVRPSEFSFSVERWTRDGVRIEQTLCLASNFLIARCAFRTACEIDGTGWLTLRQGIRVIAEQRRGEARPAG